MIISASRRTDIPAFYSDWFYERIKEGFVLVRNPMNICQVSKVSLKRDVVDCIVFWTKNPQRMMQKLHLIDEYKYYFQFTLNPYDIKFEANVPKKALLIEVFKRLSDRLGPKKVIWRYDPIILNQDIDVNYHEKYFDLLAGKLHGYTEKCVISFADYYKKIDKSFKTFGIQEIDDFKKREIATRISKIAQIYNIKIETCAEDIDLLDQGIEHSRCIDPVLIEQIVGTRISSQKDGNQREHCGCIASIDIGAYNTCAHGCIYCYANYSSEFVKRNISKYDINSPLLCSKLTEQDKVVEKDVKSCLVLQKSLFD